MCAWAAGLAMALAVGGCAEGGKGSSTDVALEAAPAAPTATAPNAVPGDAGGDPAAVAPGGEEVRHLGEPVTVTRTGTAIVDLGPRPADATHLDLRFTCLRAGSFEFADGSSAGCDAEDAPGQARKAPGAQLLALVDGEQATSVTTAPVPAGD